jgi:AcrR family transcriptional regulator
MDEALTAPAPLGRRERKKQATRAALGRAALRLALRHGVENVTVEQIATEADIALRTFRNYFSGKEEAVMASVVIGAGAFIAEFRDRPPAESVLHAVREAVLAAFDQVSLSAREHVEALRLVRSAPSLRPHQLAVLAAQEDALAAAIADRIGVDPAGPDAYPTLCAAAVMSVLRVVLDRWLDLGGAGEPPPLDALRVETDRAIAVLVAGLDRPGGQPRP